MLWGIYSAIYGEVNVSVEKCVEIKGETMLKNSKVVFYFCHLKKLVRPETFGPYCVWPHNSRHVTVLTTHVYVTHIDAANMTRTSVFHTRSPSLLTHLSKTFWILASYHSEQSGQSHMSPHFPPGNCTRWRHTTVKSRESCELLDLISQIGWHVSGCLVYHSADNRNEIILKVSAIPKRSPDYPVRRCTSTR